MELRFLGNGSGFTDSHNNAYFVNNNDMVLIDCSLLHFDKFMSMNLSKFNNVYILITHMHADHVSGLGLLLQYLYYVLRKKGIVVFSEELSSDIYEYMKISGVDIGIYDTRVAQSAGLEWLLQTISTSHAPEIKGKCFGYLLKINNKKCLYTGDTNSLESFEKFFNDVDEIYIDMSYYYGGVHLKFADVSDKLIQYSKNAVIYLMHVDNEKVLSSELEKLGSNISVAEITPPTYYTQDEIKAIRQVVAFNKKELMDLLISFSKNASDVKAQERYKHLIEKLKNEDIEAVSPDFSTKVVKGYYIDLGYVLTTCDDFHFSYDNESHELYVDCWTYQWR